MSLAGFRFRPSVKELVNVLDFLACHGDDVDVSQLTETPGDISKTEMYGDGEKEPWKLFANENKWDLLDASDAVNKKMTYVVTTLPRMKDEKVARKAGNGTWMGQSQPMVFEQDGEEIAYMKSFLYLYSGRDSEAEDKCYYYMHEYYLSKSHLQKIGARFTDYVICRIVKDSSKNCRCRIKVKRGRVDRVHSSAGTNVSLPAPVHNPTIHHQEMMQHHQDSGELAVQDTTALPPPPLPISYANLEMFLNNDDYGHGTDQEVEMQQSIFWFQCAAAGLEAQYSTLNY